MIAGGYVLDLYCDNDAPRKWGDPLVDRFGHKAGEFLVTGSMLEEFAQRIEAEERARCAMECWYLVQKYQNDPDDDGVEHWLREAENAIRARGPNKA